ncbi:MAG TPA: ATP-binding cassette domain-containing protein, partial [Spirochaetia bacterium]|nr:ATP-binding cassette domain-containing protein [Spirochaetia bacterium]
IRIGEGNRIALVSFERQQALYSRETEMDFARSFSGSFDNQLTTRHLLGDAPEAGYPAMLREAIRYFDFSALMDRPFRHLSAGEMRKALVLQALAGSPTLLLLDEPFDGLDESSRAALAGHFRLLMHSGVHLVLVTHRADELIEGITHLLVIRDGTVVAAGPAAEVARSGEALFARTAPPAARRPSRVLPLPEVSAAVGDLLVDFRGVTVDFDGRRVLDDLHWQLRRGEHWGVFGPNGSGKTTILNLIVGRNLQAYAQDVRVFGNRRGRGDTLWDLRRRTGIVSPIIQLEYAKRVAVQDVVLSGFDGSVGLYRRPTSGETASAGRTLALLGITHLATRPLAQLSYGQQRLVLIARAMVKQPELLLLDEPCQGLDPENRERVIGAIDEICLTAEVSLIYVSHHFDEYPSSLTHSLTLDGAGRAHPARLQP